jgi:hypothetical protein
LDIGTSFSDVIERRRSTRVLAPASFSQITRWLSLSLAARLIGSGEARRIYRPAVSAGALHPIEVVLVRGIEHPVALYYDPLGNSISRISNLDRDRAMAALEACAVVIPKARGDFVFLLAAAAKTAAYYSDPQSLYWRDAGAVLQTLAIAAEALDLGFCPLGILGSEILPALGLDPAKILPVGVCAVGTTVS